MEADTIKELEERIAILENKIDTMTKSVEDLVIAWNTAKGVTSFVKWLAGAVTATGVVYAAFFHNGVPK